MKMLFGVGDIRPLEGSQQGQKGKEEGRLRMPCSSVKPSKSIQTCTMTKSTVQLASGYPMPLVGFGLWKVPAETAADTVYNARQPPRALTSEFEKLTNVSRLSRPAIDCSTEHTTTRTRRRLAKAFGVLSTRAS
jgi:hypothetical protein